MYRELKRLILEALTAHNIPSNDFAAVLRLIASELDGTSSPSSQLTVQAHGTNPFGPITLPEKPRTLYSQRPRGQGLEDFLRDVWKPWIDAKALTRPLLLKHDPGAYAALAREKNIGLVIPKKSELVDIEVSNVDLVREARRLLRSYERHSKLETSSQKHFDVQELRKARRLVAAANRRKRLARTENTPPTSLR